jgi:hypothetical protein
MRFDDLVRSERYFTATLLPLLLFHKRDGICGVQQFVKLVDDKATEYKKTDEQITEHDKDGKQVPKGTTDYNDFKDVEVITELHIARDLKAEHLRLCEDKVEPSKEGEQEHKDAPDVVIVVGQELMVCEGKFFMFFSDSDADDLNEQLDSQRRQVRHLFLSRPSMRAYRHVAILPFRPTTRDVKADVVITWGEIGGLAEKLMGRDHYVTARLRNALERHKCELGDPTKRNYDDIISFHKMREKCRERGKEIQVGYVQGEAALLKLSLPEAENKQWKWRDPKTNKGKIVRDNWLSGERWLEIVESAHGFGGRGA